ncbi:hypothetical protein K08M3_51820 [Vibrio alginolyticus]|jgi:hypothetical protein|uniref:Uncharacterized protein n=1 Tax=Vibrio alginolyticus TaxID=663 RepID=A0A1W6V9V9_VIBAL|nr:MULTISPECIES: hypothetical protein [Vibrio harveyi group]ARP06658.1 hypothetical protein K04M1_51350 [Vibrio alginolyticus]ARP11791.1 hypothetical protein K04M3_52220 [Vibrio alginolyticus]ARP16844.1 hypothetical protein K04M5_51920 [Vibrio alginolyticus]ARP21881.1 hypothetical protein K05K4_51790 [Vibrio alginolyticus]ARP26969.1 hypothetical protein K06K5_51690 [Vibrio alginolyticus]
MTSAETKEEKNYQEINDQRKAMFKFHIETEFPALRRKRSGIVFSLRIVEQIGAFVKGDNKPDWADAFTCIEDEDKGRIHSIDQLIRNYVIELTRNVEYRINTLQAFMVMPETGRLNLDGTTAEVTPTDAINTIQALKSHEKYQLMEKTHIGRMVKSVENRIKMNTENAKGTAS